jgi:hypothetical protein
MTPAEILLAIRALSELARTLLREDRDATPEELDLVDLRAADAERRLREAIRRAEGRAGPPGARADLPPP